MAVNKVTYGGETLIDLTSDTVTAATLAQGVKAHDKSGAAIVGTMVQQSGVQMATGTFAGNGGTTCTVSGLGFKPTTVYVFVASITDTLTQLTTYRPLNMSSNGVSHGVYNGRFQNMSDRITLSIESNGFTVTATKNSTFFVNQVVYRYIAYT